MSEGEIFSWLIGFVMGVCLATGVWLWADRKAQDISINDVPQERVELMDMDKWKPETIEEITQELKGTNDFSVTGKPRTVPWKQRRKELEAAARTKRKRLKSFQEHI
jgi:hypothetical protein